MPLTLLNHYQIPTKILTSKAIREKITSGIWVWVRRLDKLGAIAFEIRINGQIE